MSNNRENPKPQDGPQPEQNKQSQNSQPQPEPQSTSPNHASPISETTYERFDGAENTNDWVSFD